MNSACSCAKREGGRAVTNTDEDTDEENILHSDRFEVEEDARLFILAVSGSQYELHQHTTGRIVGRQVSPGRRYSGQGVDRVRCQVVDRSSRKQVIIWNIASCASLRNDVRSGLGSFDLWALRVPNSRPLFSTIGPTLEVCNNSNLCSVEAWKQGGASLAPGQRSISARVTALLATSKHSLRNSRRSEQQPNGARNVTNPYP